MTQKRTISEVGNSVFTQICFGPNNEFYRKMKNKVQQNVKMKSKKVATEIEFSTLWEAAKKQCLKVHFLLHNSMT